MCVRKLFAKLLHKKKDRNMNDNLQKFAKFYNDFELTYDQDVTDIYHYTSPAGMKGILEKSTLRFTDRSYLNDQTEGKYALTLTLEHLDEIDVPDKYKTLLKKSIEDRIEDIQNDFFYIYQCSFSTDPDSLCLWNYYSKDAGIKGYNAHFHAENLGDIVRVKPNEKAPNKTNDKIIHGKVIYDEDRQLQIVKEIIDRFIKYSDEANDRIGDFYMSYVAKKIQMQGIFFKMPCFAVEKEYRLAIDQYIGDDGKFYAIGNDREFMERGGIFIPYVDLEFVKENLVGITMSPTLNPETTGNSLKGICANKYPNLKHNISRSAIPVRY